MARQARRLLLGVAVVAVALLLLARNREAPMPAPEPEAPLAQPMPPAEEAPPAVDVPPPVARGPGPHRIESGATLGLLVEDLAEESELRLDLRLPPEAIGANPPPLRVIAPDGRVLETLGEIGGEPGSVGLVLDPAWLRPGRYIVEIKTKEKSHFPLRRYALEVD